jgi:hypothetical protein
MQAKSTAGGIEELANLVGEDSLTAHALAEPRIVELAPAQGADATQDLCFLLRRMPLEPLLEQRSHGSRKAQDLAGGVLGAGGGGGFQDGGNFVVREGRDYGSDEYAHRNAGLGKFTDGGQSGLGWRGAGFEHASQVGDQCGEGDGDRDGLVPGEFLEQIKVPGDEFVFGDDTDGVAECGEDFEALAGESEFAFDGLVAVGDAAEGDDLGLPAGRGEGLPEQGRGILLDQDAGFEVQTGGETKIFMRRSGVTIDAPVFATAVGVHAHGKTQVRTVVGREDRAGQVPVESSGRRRFLRIEPVGIAFEREGFEAIGRIVRGSPIGRGRRWRGHGSICPTNQQPSRGGQGNDASRKPNHSVIPPVPN